MGDVEQGDAEDWHFENIRCCVRIADVAARVSEGEQLRCMEKGKI
jgi:hypothetical protein